MNVQLVDLLAGKLKLRAPRRVLEVLLAQREIGQVIEAAAQRSAENSFDDALDALNITYECTEQERGRIPSRGPVLLVANHPFGMLEGLILGSLLRRIRSDFRFVANSLLKGVPGIGDYVLPVDPFADGPTAIENSRSLRKAYRWLESGGLLVAFPAGAVSTLQGVPPLVADGEWSSRLLRMARRTKSIVVPAFFHGRNSALFQFAGLLHPSARTALLCRELLNKRGGRYTIAIGSPVKPERHSLFESDSALTEYIRARTYALAQRASVRNTQEDQAPIVDSQPPDNLALDVACLPVNSLLFAKGDYEVRVAHAAQLPSLLLEIARLREISFRAAGEGTGREMDLDKFDTYYRHVFLWKLSTREVIGAYRIADVASVVEAFGPEGLYTHTLFDFQPEFLRRLQDGMELGRSFIRPEYQRSVHMLHYLWKGIGAYLDRSPRRYLFGPVSISAEYGDAAREMIVAYFEQRQSGQHVEPRCRFRCRRQAQLTNLARSARHIADLSELVADLQNDGREIPVLLRHYLNLGGQVLGFNVDNAFSRALDGLLLVDLERGNTAAIERYLGKAGLNRSERPPIERAPDLQPELCT